MKCYGDQANQRAIVDYAPQTFSALGFPVSEKQVEPLQALRSLRFAVGPIQGVAPPVIGNPSQKPMSLI